MNRHSKQNGQNGQPNGFSSQGAARPNGDHSRGQRGDSRSSDPHGYEDPRRNTRYLNTDNSYRNGGRGDESRQFRTGNMSGQQGGAHGSENRYRQNQEWDLGDDYFNHAATYGNEGRHFGSNEMGDSHEHHAYGDYGDHDNRANQFGGRDYDEPQHHDMRDLGYGGGQYRQQPSRGPAPYGAQSQYPRPQTGSGQYARGMNQYGGRQFGGGLHGNDGQSGPEYRGSEYGSRHVQSWDRANDGGDRGQNFSELSQPRRMGKGPKGYKRTDERIKEDVSERLAQHGDVDASDVEIAVKDGEVTLTGTVVDRAMKFRIEHVADAVSGVTDVTNQLKVKRAETSSTTRR